MDEIAQLQTYLENGGKVLLTTSGYTETPNLDAAVSYTHLDVYQRQVHPRGG